MRVRILLAAGTAGVLLMGASASADELRGRAELGVDNTGTATGCYLALHKLTRVNRDDRNDRWLKVVTSVNCMGSATNWTAGHQTVRIMGLGRQGAWATRLMVERVYREGIAAGGTKRLRDIVRCNHQRRDGSWVYAKNNMGLRAWAEVHVDNGPWHAATVEDKKTSVYC
jgi:hypothetical protein